MFPDRYKYGDSKIFAVSSGTCKIISIRAIWNFAHNWISCHLKNILTQKWIKKTLCYNEVKFLLFVKLVIQTETFQLKFFPKLTAFMRNIALCFTLNFYWMRLMLASIIVFRPSVSLWTVKLTTDMSWHSERWDVNFIKYSWLSLIQGHLVWYLLDERGDTIDKMVKYTGSHFITHTSGNTVN